MVLKVLRMGALLARLLDGAAGQAWLVQIDEGLASSRSQLQQQKQKQEQRAASASAARAGCQHQQQR